MEDVVATESVDGVVFGAANEDWLRLLAKMSPDDELWYFEPPAMNAIQIGGVALVRKGEIVAKVIAWIA